MALCFLSLIWKSRSTAGFDHDFWQSRVAQVDVGLMRSEVEQLLSPRLGGVDIEFGSAQNTIYILEGRFRVSILYKNDTVLRTSSLLTE